MFPFVFPQYAEHVDTFLGCVFYLNQSESTHRSHSAVPRSWYPPELLSDILDGGLKLRRLQHYGINTVNNNVFERKPLLLGKANAQMRRPVSRKPKPENLNHVSIVWFHRFWINE